VLTNDKRALIAVAGDKELCILPKLANRHGLITGATGTGKTVTLQNLAETFSQMGVPVFLADVKGDLSGISAKGQPKGKIAQRVEELGLPGKGYVNQGFPVAFWDVFGKEGHPLRTTVSAMGPLLLARLLNLNEVQSGVLTMAFRIADDQGLLLLDMKDLRSMLKFIADNREQFQDYGNISAASVGAIQRGLLRLEEEGGDAFFGEPALDIADLLQTDENGKGVVNILASDQLINSPRIYSTLLVWLLSELFERLPEVGDPEKPKLVFFFDEAHLLFDDAEPVLLEKIEQVVRLIRSRGVGVYFVTQNPADIPDSVLGQLGNRVQHALRAFTPKEQKSVRVAAESFRANPAFDTAKVITELGVGEALVSFLDEKGRPNVVERALVAPPQSFVGPISPEERTRLMRTSLVAGVYDKALDRESAYEVLAKRTAELQKKADEAAAEAARAKEEKERAKLEREREREEARAEREREKNDVFGGFVKSATRNISNTVGREIGRQIVRGILGGLFGKRR
jgi:uncharacterized protein